MKKNPIDILKVKRPWGDFTQFTKNVSSTVKIISVKPRQALSLQYHLHREEFWHVLSGSGTVLIGDKKKLKKFTAKPGKEFSVAVKELHRIMAGDGHLIILEIGTGKFDEQDIIRTEDKYGRGKKK